ncbi:MAG: homoserine kinase [Acidimicrobiia bacterium]|nr:MAG: homoserine kinase [Acidimicrobiia bacterium]
MAPTETGSASAPASSANLGPGFDCLAVALELRCRVEAVPAASWRVEHDGDQRHDGATDDAVLAAAQRAVGEDRPLLLRVENQIPIGRGLGSSAAAHAAGALAAWRAYGHEPSRLRLFELVAGMEGHPDNAAAAVYGGLVLVAGSEPHRLPWNPVWRLVLAVPDSRLPTNHARAALPTSYPTEVVVRSLARTAALVAGLLTGDAELLAAASGDELHEEPRRRIRPDVTELVQVARTSGAAHAAWSGAGPSVVAMVAADRIDKVVDALRRHLDGRGIVLIPDVATAGAE